MMAQRPIRRIARTDFWQRMRTQAMTMMFSRTGEFQQHRWGTTIFAYRIVSTTRLGNGVDAVEM
jgi:hypothetical protein